MAEVKNVAQLLTAMARQYSSREAILAPVGVSARHRVKFQALTFAELENLVNAYAAHVSAHGLRPGMRVLMMMRPGLEFTAAAFAMFKIGAVPVFIDPGMGRSNFLNCVRSTQPEALLAISAVHWLRHLFRGSFRSVKIAISCGACPPPGVTRLETAATPANIKTNGAAVYETYDNAIDDMAAILFTTGSTGPAKGVEYTHQTFLTQVETIRQVYDAGPQHVDMSAFPLFALFAVAMGMKSVIPKMDFTRPAQADPRIIINIVRDQQVSFSFGSPAFWRTVADYAIHHHIRLDSLKTVLMAGAPVNAELHRKVKQIINPHGETRVPYGATEALPITDFNGTEMLRETAIKSAEGEGYCVGYPNPGMTIKVIADTPGPIEQWDDRLVLPPCQKGEIAVRGKVVTARYYQNPDATALAKITDADRQVWHRLGDMGYFDTKGRLWFCGRKNHRVITPAMTYYSVCTEAVFNNHPRVFRTALVGVAGADGITVPVLMVQPRPAHFPNTEGKRQAFIRELRKTGENYDYSKNIETFLFLSDFPVDIRHNAKIFREKLAVTAARMMAAGT